MKIHLGYDVKLQNIKEELESALLKCSNSKQVDKILLQYNCDAAFIRFARSEAALMIAPLEGSTLNTPFLHGGIINIKVIY